MVKFRRARRSDLEDFYAISLATGHQGGDATQLYNDPKLMGHIYSAPYLMLSRDTCLVAEDEHGVAGFAVGAISTRLFGDHLEQEWWPTGILSRPGGTCRAAVQSWSEPTSKLARP